MWLLTIIALIGLGLYYGHDWLVNLGIGLALLPLLIVAVVVIPMFIVLGIVAIVAIWKVFKD